MTSGKPRDAEYVIASAVIEGTWARCVATCSTWSGRTVSAGADATIVERARVRGIGRLTRARRRRARVERIATAFAREDDHAGTTAPRRLPAPVLREPVGDIRRCQRRAGVARHESIKRVAINNERKT